MKLSDAKTQLAEFKAHSYSDEQLVRWLSDIDRKIWNDVIRWHENTAIVESYDDEGSVITDMPEPEVYSTDAMDTTTLLVPEPYSDLYIKYMCAMIDYYDGDFARYNNNMVMFNVAYEEYSGWYNRNHTPKQTCSVGV